MALETGSAQAMSENISRPQDLVQKWRKESAGIADYVFTEDAPGVARSMIICAKELEAAYPAWEASVKLAARSAVEHFRTDSSLRTFSVGNGSRDSRWTKIAEFSVAASGQMQTLDSRSAQEALRAGR